MPLYEYRCKSCGFRFEKIQKVNEAAEIACPKCGGELIRPLTAPALQFKGAGWYVNDYASKSSSSSGEKASGDSAGSGETKAGESKPAAESKPESKPASTDSSAPTTKS